MADEMIPTLDISPQTEEAGSVLGNDEPEADHNEDDGRLSTIEEGSEEATDELLLECFYAELTEILNTRMHIYFRRCPST